MDIKMIQADVSHVALLSKLGSETFSETFAQHNNPADFNEYLQKSFNPVQIEKEIREPGSLFILAKVDEEIAGYARLRESDELEQTFPEKRTIELQRIYSHSSFMGKGVGKALLLHCLDVAKERGCDILWLGVWEHNHNAIQFYKHFGFKAFDSHVFMLGSEAQTDILMKKNLTV
jgi:ribosomal protein S18 acetylase RimI-like enzyme